MDQFTQIALARSRGGGLIELEAAETEKGPITVEERLAFAYRDGVPKVVARMLINWELPDARDSYHRGQAAMTIYQGLEARELAARKREREIAESLPGIESRLATLRAEYAGLRSQLERPPAFHLTPRELGLME